MEGEEGGASEVSTSTPASTDVPSTVVETKKNGGGPMLSGGALKMKRFHPLTRRRNKDDKPLEAETLLIRNIPPDFLMHHCIAIFSILPGFQGFRFIEKGIGSGYATFLTPGHAQQAVDILRRGMNPFRISVKGTTQCDQCEAVVSMWMSCPCRSLTYCSPRCLLIYRQTGRHAGRPCPILKPQAGQKCRCSELGENFVPGLIKCVCQNAIFCSVSCLKSRLALHETYCVVQPPPPPPPTGFVGMQMVMADGEGGVGPPGGPPRGGGPMRGQGVRMGGPRPQAPGTGGGHWRTYRLGVPPPIRRQQLFF